MDVYKSTCRMDHGGCGVLVYVDNGKVVKVVGDPECITNRGTLCSKGRASIELLYHPDRLRHPMKRIAERGEGKWERISWNEALDIISSRLKEIIEKYGTQQILRIYGTGRGANHFIDRFYNALGALSTTGNYCYGPRITVSRVTCGYRLPVCDFYGFGGVYPKCIISWGNNLVYSNADGMSGSRLLDCLNKGAKLIVIDPVYTNLAARADIWLQIRPGTDGALALGMLNVILNDVLYDKDFVDRWTNAPFLVRNDAERLLTEKDLTSGGSSEKYVVWDLSTGSAKVYDPIKRECQSPDVKPSREGAYTIRLVNGKNVVCKTVWQLFKERLSDYTPEKVEKITWVPTTEIKAAAEMYATTKPGCIQWGVSIDQQGINTTQTIRAILILMGICGNLDVPGGMAFWVSPNHVVSGTPEFRLEHKIPQKTLEIINKYGRDEFPLLGNTMLDYKAFPAIAEGKLRVRALMVHWTSGVCAVGNIEQFFDKVLPKIDFIVVHDLFMTPLAEYADIVLPASMWLERDQLGDEMHFGWGILVRQKIVDTPEFWSDEDFILELAKRMGLQEYFPWKNIEEYLDWRLKPAGVTWQEFKKIGILMAKQEYKKYERENGFPTPTGKFELYSTIMEKNELDPLPVWREYPKENPHSELAKQYPLLCTTRRTPYFFCSEFRQITQLRKSHPDPIVEIHPKTAENYSIGDGDWVWIETPRGRIKQKAKLTKNVHEKVICTEYGWWYPEKPGPEHGMRKSNLNFILGYAPPYDPAQGSPFMRGFLCKIYKA